MTVLTPARTRLFQTVIASPSLNSTAIVGELDAGRDTRPAGSAKISSGVLNEMMNSQ